MRFLQAVSYRVKTVDAQSCKGQVRVTQVVVQVICYRRVSRIQLDLVMCSSPASGCRERLIDVVPRIFREQLRGTIELSKRYTKYGESRAIKKGWR
jgi:hypothetical protein